MSDSNMLRKAYERFPPISQELIDALDQLFPDRCPEESYSDRKIWMARGSVEVVRLLKRIKDAQDATLLDRQILL